VRNQFLKSRVKGVIYRLRVFFAALHLGGWVRNDAPPEIDAGEGDLGLSQAHGLIKTIK
jgi:hypothetical protein